VVLGLWTIFAVTWNYLTFVRHKNSCVLLSRAVCGVPCIKVIVLVFGLTFWVTCASWQMCSFWMGIALLNIQLVYETSQMTFFVLIAKGWSITRPNFSVNEWRGVIFSMSAFYMTNSIILVLQANMLSQSAFWIANAVLYGLIYLYIYSSALTQMRLVRSQVEFLRPDLPKELTWPLKMKHLMFHIFLVLVLISAAIEVLTHSLAFTDGRVWVVLLCYELSNILIMGTLGFTFRPQEYSPFFFMVPARMTDNRQRYHTS
jgi:hypothetical protein